MKNRRLTAFVAAVAVCAAGPVLFAQAPDGQGRSAQQKPVVKSIAAPPIASVEGADNYRAYCAVCHGNDGKGNGPAAPAMKSPVPDLTLIAKRHDGKFDAIAMERIIRGTDKTMATPAHGVESMPIWGDVFHGAGSVDATTTTMRVRNLVKYLQDLQR